MNSMSESRFNMWRAVTSIVHVDGVVTPHEVDFIVTNVLSLPLSDEQRATIKQDLEKPANPRDLYLKISAPRDIDDFFRLARAVSWSDGEMDEDEAHLLQRLFNMPDERNTRRPSSPDPQEGNGTDDHDVVSFIRKILSSKSGK